MSLPSLELLEHVLEEAAHLVEVVDFLVADELLLLRLTLLNDVPPVCVLPQQCLFSDDDEVAPRSRDGDVEPSAVLDKAQRARSYAAEHDDVFLSALEGVDGAHLDVVHGTIGRL